jgi:Fe2+ or Zn2+ uptake regulation protein
MPRRSRHEPTLDAATVAAVQVALAPFELRLTANRRAVLAALGGGARPLTVEEVVEAANVPKSSAYRILGEFAQAGVVSRVSGAPGGDRHELAESLSQHHHHHLVCDECGIVQDFQPSRQFEQRIEREVSAILAASGFEVTQHVFDVRGRCRECVSAR